MKRSGYKVSARFELTIPREAREVLHIKAGDFLSLEILDGMVIIRKSEPSGAAKESEPDGTLEAMASKVSTRKRYRRC